MTYGKVSVSIGGGPVDEVYTPPELLHTETWTYQRRAIEAPMHGLPVFTETVAVTVELLRVDGDLNLRYYRRCDRGPAHNHSWMPVANSSGDKFLRTVLQPEAAYERMVAAITQADDLARLHAGAL